ncbi:hypothetical protein [Pararhizobium sp.]|uniref:hypothetical protein n=1 Tax=Pararhizobium sp. TaxID=1977563 RepID=UPI002724A068|nr:hypothetical protein [Pararhizobium sp.]MDO9418178.1 hypothetical protein [Pararhizobium sp.]
MRKIILVCMIALTAAASMAAPSFAQQRGNDRSSETRSGDFYEGTNKQQRRPRYLFETSGAYCSTNWIVLYDKYGNKTRVRHCDERRDVEID